MLPVPTTGEARCAHQGGPPFDEERSATDGFQDLGLDVALGTRLHQQTQVYQAHVHAGGPSDPRLAQASTLCQHVAGISFTLHQFREALPQRTLPQHGRSSQTARPSTPGLRRRAAEVHPPSSCSCFVAACPGSSRCGRSPSPGTRQPAPSRAPCADRRTRRVRPLPLVGAIQRGPGTIQLGQCFQHNIRSTRSARGRGGPYRQRQALRDAPGVSTAIVTCARLPVNCSLRPLHTELLESPLQHNASLPTPTAARCVSDPAGRPSRPSASSSGLRSRLPRPRWMRTTREFAFFFRRKRGSTPARPWRGRKRCSHPGSQSMSRMQRACPRITHAPRPLRVCCYTRQHVGVALPISFDPVRRPPHRPPAGQGLASLPGLFACPEKRRLRADPPGCPRPGTPCHACRATITAAQSAVPQHSLSVSWPPRDHPP